jgi:acyl carrier protein
MLVTTAQIEPISNTLIIEKMKPVLKTVLKLSNVDAVGPHSRLFEDLNLDTTSSQELLIALEEVIEGLVINPETLNADHFRSVETLAGYVQESLAARN